MPGKGCPGIRSTSKGVFEKLPAIAVTVGVWLAGATLCQALKFRMRGWAFGPHVPPPFPGVGQAAAVAAATMVGGAWHPVFL